MLTMHVTLHSVGDGTALVIESPEGGCTAVFERDGMQATIVLTKHERVRLRGAFRRGAASGRRAARPTPEGADHA
jgi:hypothetical protein